MLENVNLNQKTDKDTFKQRMKELKPALYDLQQPLKKSGISVIILFEGWGASGKGSMISNLILNFDPRNFNVHTIALPDEQEKRYPFLWRHWQTLPPKGKISVLDRSWYQDVSISRLERGQSGEEALRRIRKINAFERQLSDNGTLILKFFLHISQQEQKARFEKLYSNKNTAWRVTETDKHRNRLYDKYYKVFDEVLEATNTPYAPWYTVSGMDSRTAEIQVFSIVLDRIQAAMEAKANPEPAADLPFLGDFPIIGHEKLSDCPLGGVLEKDEYKDSLAKLQGRLKYLHGKLYRKRVPVILVFEGWDAAGKGGAIRRVTEALDPRGYEVVPVAAPSQEEIDRHYLWRFWRKLPKNGHVAIFDRSWYGRVLVERVENLTPEKDWRRAYREINEFEQGLADWGAVILKFWMNIDQDEQLRRFEMRQNTPSKQWKITDEDWRNREKWGRYEEAVNDMMQNTSTKYAPWHVISSEDKKYGRTQVLKIIAEALEKRLG
ncbi:MAG: polyphosphate:AMP phosphotransferase [Clostridiales bacterium]|nr:polyphosphate:AMP phosphotransferase [Clostridiales bacterium]